MINVELNDLPQRLTRLQVSLYFTTVVGAMMETFEKQVPNDKA